MLLLYKTATIAMQKSKYHLSKTFFFTNHNDFMSSTVTVSLFVKPDGAKLFLGFAIFESRCTESLLQSLGVFTKIVAEF